MTREQFVKQVGQEQAALRRFLTALCCGESAEADDIAQGHSSKPIFTAVNTMSADSLRHG